MLGARRPRRCATSWSACGAARACSRRRRRWRRVGEVVVVARGPEGEIAGVNTAYVDRPGGLPVATGSTAPSCARRTGPRVGAAGRDVRAGDRSPARRTSIADAAARTSGTGPVRTHALYIGSPAIDAGSQSSKASTTTSAGRASRAQVGAAADIGAFEGAIAAPGGAAGADAGRRCSSALLAAHARGERGDPAAATKQVRDPDLRSAARLGDLAGGYAAAGRVAIPRGAGARVNANLDLAHSPAAGGGRDSAWKGARRDGPSHGSPP